MSDDPWKNETNYNVVCLSTSDSSATQLCKSISGSDSLWRGYYVKNYEHHRIVTYPRYPNCPKDLPHTAYADALVAELSGPEDFKLVEEYIRARGRIHCIIFYSNYDFSEQAKTFRKGVSMWLKTSENNFKKLRSIIFSEGDKLNKQIRQFFDEIDIKKNGFIEKEEVELMASKLGENVSDEEFKNMSAIMSNNKDCKVDFNEFVTWWKLGRQNTKVMERLIKLNLLTKQITKDVYPVDFHLEDFQQAEEESYHQYLKYYSSTIENPGIQLLFNAFVGGDLKVDEVGGYIKRFTDNPNTKYSRFVHVVVHFKNGTDIPKAKESLEKLRTMGLDIFGKLMPDEALFVKSFFLMESIEKDNTVILVMRLKLDVQEQFESAISPFLQILNFMFSPKVLSHVLVDFRVKNSFETIFKNNLKGLEAIKDYSFELKADLIRNKMISLLKSYYPLGRSHKIIEFLLNPSDISLEIKSAFGNLLINDDNRQKFNVPLSFLKTILSEMLLPKASMYFPLITAIDGVEFTINTQRVFANVKVNVPGLID